MLLCLPRMPRSLSRSRRSSPPESAKREPISLFHSARLQWEHYLTVLAMLELLRRGIFVTQVEEPAEDSQKQNLNRVQFLNCSGEVAHRAWLWWWGEWSQTAPKATETTGPECPTEWATHWWLPPFLCGQLRQPPSSKISQRSHCTETHISVSHSSYWGIVSSHKA